MGFEIQTNEQTYIPCTERQVTVTVIATVEVKLSDVELKWMSKVGIVYKVLMLNVVKG